MHFISNASIHLFLMVQLSHPYVATGHTRAFMSLTLVVNFQGRFHRWGCWGCIPLHQQCLLLWSNNINGPPRATPKHVVPPMQYMYSDMEMIMVVSLNAKSDRTRRNVDD